MTVKTTFLFLAFCTAAVITRAQTADDIVNKYVEALGGKEKLATLKTVVRDGALNYNGMDLPLTLSAEQGKGFRMEINVMGTAGYQIITSTEGWSYMPFQGQSSVEKMTEQQVTDGQDDLDIQGELFNYTAKGNTVELMGKEKMDGVEAYKLKLTPKTGLVKTIYIDAATYYINKIIVFDKDKTSEVSYRNYKATAEGYVFAFTLVRPEGEVIFSKISANTTLPDNIFKPEN